MSEIKKDYTTNFYLTENDTCMPECPFGKGVRVGSSDCERECKSFIKIAWLKRESYSVPVRGIVVCYGGEEK